MRNSHLIVRVLISTLALLFATTLCATAAEMRLATKWADGGEAVIIFASNPFQTMTEIPFSIQLHKKTGEEIRDAELALGLTMPAMAMPANNPKAVWQDKAYRGKASSPWQGNGRSMSRFIVPGMKWNRLFLTLKWL